MYAIIRGKLGVHCKVGIHCLNRMDRRLSLDKLIFQLLLEVQVLVQLLVDLLFRACLYRIQELC